MVVVCSAAPPTRASSAAALPCPHVHVRVLVLCAGLSLAPIHGADSSEARGDPAEEVVLLRHLVNEQVCVCACQVLFVFSCGDAAAERTANVDGVVGFCVTLHLLRVFFFVCVVQGNGSNGRQAEGVPDPDTAHGG